MMLFYVRLTVNVNKLNFFSVSLHFFLTTKLLLVIVLKTLLFFYL